MQMPEASLFSCILAEVRLAATTAPVRETELLSAEDQNLSDRYRTPYGTTDVRDIQARYGLQMPRGSTQPSWSACGDAGM